MNRHPSSGALPSAQLFAEKFFNALERFLHVEAVSGILLLIAAAAALVWANSPLAASYHHLWELPVSLGVGDVSFTQSLHFIINDVLMAVFFLVVGMEIRREMHEGALAELRAAALPLAAALGGVAVPAVIYLIANGEPGLRDGWAIPTATDIAFAVGVLALLGRSIPVSIRIFLLALAIIDDIAAVIIIALFYSGGLDYSGLFIAAAGILLVLGLRTIGVRNASAYMVAGIVMWTGLLQAGVHPTLAGVAVGILAPIEHTQKSLHPWVAFVIMPLFALANAGVAFDGVRLDAGEAQSVLFGVAIALVIGKPIGIFLGSWIAVRVGWCQLPAGVTWRGVLLVGCLGGIGFTMSIFIATLAFADAQLLGAAKLGILLASFVAGVIGFALGRSYIRDARRSETADAPAA